MVHNLQSSHGMSFHTMPYLVWLDKDLVLSTELPFAHAVAAVLWAVRGSMADQWAALSPTIPTLPTSISCGPVSWSLPSLSWPWWGRGGEGYSEISMADTDLYNNVEGGNAACTESFAIPYQAPQSMPLLQDPHTFPANALDS